MSSETPRTVTSEWKWRRREAIIRDSYTCQKCGAQGGPEGEVELHAHHVVPFAAGGDDDPENLVTLCKGCHYDEHSKSEGGEHTQLKCAESLKNKNRDEETGKFTSKYSPEDFLDALEELGGSGGTSDVAEIVGCPDRTAYHHLDNLREDGRITSQSIGASNLWRLAGDG